MSIEGGYRGSESLVPMGQCSLGVTPYNISEIPLEAQMVISDILIFGPSLVTLVTLAIRSAP
jgi:hypothetical protein